MISQIMEFALFILVLFFVVPAMVVFFWVGSDGAYRKPPVALPFQRL